MLWLLVGLGALAIWSFAAIGNNNAQKKNIVEIAQTQLPAGAPILTKMPVIGPLRGIGIADDYLLLIDGAVLYPVASTALITVEVITDGRTISKVSRPSQIAGGVIGAAIAGPVGAIIGGLGASSFTTVAPPKEVKLRLLLADTLYPKFDIDFIELTTTGNTYGPVSLDEAETWSARLQGVLHKLN